VIQMIRFRDYSVAYGNNSVLTNFNFNIEIGKTYAVVGPSGCGKTTLVYSISDLLPQTAVSSGDCESETQVSKATVLQDYGLFPWKSVYDNATLPLTLKNVPITICNTKAEAVFNKLGISNLTARYPHELSGGQKQRVAIARALITEPDLIVMDEPFSSVDTITREKLQDDLKCLIKESGNTLFLVTHNIEEAVYLAQQVLVLNDEGTLVKVFDNPCYEVSDGREQDLFYKICIQIRKCMKGDI